MARSLRRRLGGHTHRAEAALFVGLLAFSCAFAPSSDTDGQGGLPTAGVSDYAVASLKVCAAGKIVLPADGQLSGFCMTEVSAGRMPCSADGDCLERETCICGQCRLTPCTNVECPVGLRCDGRSGRCLHTCPIPTSCGGGAACYDGFCMPICADDHDCGAGESCGPIPCDSDAACPVGDTCTCEGKQGATCASTGACARQYCLATRCKSDAECDTTRFNACTGVGVRLAAPAVVATDRGASMFVERVGADGLTAILRADSADGLAWDLDTVPVVAPDAAWEATRTGAPAVFFDGDQVVMYYAGGDGAGIGIAVSDDGIAWQKYDANPVFAVQGSGSGKPCPLGEGTASSACQAGEHCYPGASGQDGVCLARWERGRVDAPSVLRAGGTYLMFYEGGQGAGIGLATSKDGLSFEKFQDDPVLAAEEVSTPRICQTDKQVGSGESGAPWCDVTAIGSPSVAVESLWDGSIVFRMWFAALGKESLPNPTNTDPRANWSIGYAASTNAVAWKGYAYNPVFDHLVLLDHLNETGPSVVKLNDLYYLYYADPDNGGLGAAVSGLAPKDRVATK